MEIITWNTDIEFVEEEMLCVPVWLLMRTHEYWS